MCEPSIYQIFLQAVGVVAIAGFFTLLLASLSGFNLGLVDEEEEGGKKR
jgi:hypothetical protein